MPEQPYNVRCPNGTLEYRAGVHEVCPHCGETEGHSGLVKKEPEAAPARPSRRR